MGVVDFFFFLYKSSLGIADNILTLAQNMSLVC